MSFWIRLRAPRVRCALTRRDTSTFRDVSTRLGRHALVIRSGNPYHPLTAVPVPPHSVPGHMARLLSVALTVLLIVGRAHGSWLSDATGVNIEPNKPITVGPPDPIGATQKAIQNLPKTIMELPGAPLAEAIRRGRERAIGSASPIPG